MQTHFPHKQGLYDPSLEKDSCGVGFVCNIKGRASNQILRDAEQMNCSMEHRGGVGYEVNSGDGAGILTALPHRLFTQIADQTFNQKLGQRGNYAAGNVFLPHNPQLQEHCIRVVEEEIAELGQSLIGWRDLPVDPDAANLGNAARSAMPVIKQLFIAASDGDSDTFERNLYLIRKHASKRLREELATASQADFYVCSLSSRIIVYKGMLTPQQLFLFFTDLQEERYETHLAMVHSRFSTNTFPSWDRAQPNRFMSHNGEINTLLGNVNAMNSRQGSAASSRFGDDLDKLFPVVEPDCSDSGTFDSVLEFLLMNGRELHEAVMLMIPEAWQQHANMSPEKKAFYEYHSCFMEPWDGPASIAFSDGNYIGAVLDRNGLRPSRYYITKDDKCIMASEVGVIDIDPKTIVEKGRLQPGRMFLIDFAAGRMIPDEELKENLANKYPYSDWLNDQRISLSDLDVVESVGSNPATLTERMVAFGYTVETMQFMLQPMVSELRDPLGSMGNDAALAVMSDKPRILYDYFKQRFAQVTNPIREELIIAL